MDVSLVSKLRETFTEIIKITEITEKFSNFQFYRNIFRLSVKLDIGCLSLKIDSQVAQRYVVCP